MGNAYNNEPVETYGKGIRDIDLSFSPAAAGAPTNVRGPYVATIVRTSQGLFTVTFEEVFKPNVFLGGFVQVRDNANLVARIGKIGTVAWTASPVTATIYVLDDALAVQDIAANADSYVRATLRFKVSPVKDATGWGGV